MGQEASTIKGPNQYAKGKCPGGKIRSGGKGKGQGHGKGKGPIGQPKK